MAAMPVPFAVTIARGETTRSVGVHWIMPTGGGWRASLPTPCPIRGRDRVLWAGREWVAGTPSPSTYGEAPAVQIELNPAACRRVDRRAGESLRE